MKVGIDGTFITPVHQGGKDQVILNLLKGFEAIGASGSLIVACDSRAEGLFAASAPSARRIPIAMGGRDGRPAPLVRRNWARTFEIPGKLLGAGAEFILFPSYNTSLRRLPVPSAVIPHDLQPKVRRDSFSFRGRVGKNAYLAADFLFRDSIIAVSDYDAGTIKEFYPQYARKVVRIYNPIALSPEAVPSPKEPLILAVNTQFPHKNTMTLIQAFEQLLDVFPHRLFLVGRPSSYGTSLMEYVERRPRLSGRVEFPGFLSDNDLDRLYRTCDLYVNPSLFEGFGMTAVEAMIKGAPVLVADVAANREVTAGLCGYYAPAESSDVLASAMADTLRRPYDPGEAERKAHILHGRYNASTIAREYWAFFERTLRRS
ncbi:MAG TPA: hypothetical protein DIC53_08075 [Synergistaceae bacterium]|nr:hypothetical protein [Synergistaceae bacterium]